MQMTRLIDQFQTRWRSLEKKFMPAYVWTADPLTFWRERILFVICFSITVFGPLALLPSLALAYIEGLWGVIAVDIMAYGVAVGILLAKDTPFPRRALTFCLMLYALAISLLFILGPVGAGYIWLFGASVLISSFIGLSASIIALVTNAVILAAVALFIAYGQPQWALAMARPLETWLVMAVNFLVLNTFVTITTAFLQNGLKQAFLAEQEISRSLRQNEELLRGYLENAPDGVTLNDLKGNLTYVNRKYEEITGFTRAEVIGKNLLKSNFLPPEALKTAVQFVQDNLTGQPSGSHEIEMITKDGRRIPADINISVIRGTGEPTVLSFVRDITDRKQAEEACLMSEERFRHIFEEGPFGMGLQTPDRVILAANKVLCAHLGYTEQELVGRNTTELTHEEDRERSKELLSQLFDKRQDVIRMEKRYIKKDGSILWAHTTVTAVHNRQGDVPYALAVIEDLTESRKAAEKIHLLAYYDSLTGLPNRTFHRELIKRSMDHAKRHKETFAVLDIGLDNFQRINDSLGFSVGDLLLKTVGDRLTRTLRKSDAVGRSGSQDTVNLVSRVGGDEFIVLAHDLARVEDAATLSSRILEEMALPFELGGHEIFLTASIGIALYPNDATEVDDLLVNAEKAMRHTKTEGKNNYSFYSKSMNASVLELLTLEGHLRKALKRDELVLHYQPKVDAITRRLSGMEALIRWQHPKRGLIPPLQFIGLAETSGLILPIGQWVIHEVCRQIRQWIQGGHKQIYVALNVSSRQFDQQDLAGIVGQALRDTGIPPMCLNLEITESTLMKNPEKGIRTITALKSMGIGISIDDFGTGYSSLSYLKQLPLDYLKIDQSFVRGIAHDAKDQAIVRATIAMAHSLDLRTIAEGVETEEQLAFLRECQCDEIQGYLFSRPRPANELPDILTKGYL